MKSMIFDFCWAAIVLFGAMYFATEGSWIMCAVFCAATVASIWCGCVKLFLLIHKDFRSAQFPPED